MRAHSIAVETQAMPEHAMWYRIAPFAAYVFFMLLADLLSILGWNSYELRWLYAVKIMVVVILLWKLSGHYKELALPRFISWNTWAIAVLAGVGIFLAWINLTTDWMVTGQSAGFDPRQNNAISPALALMRWSGAALVIPVMEELFWRSFVLRWLSQANFLALDPAQVSWRAFVLTAVLFAVQHHLWLAGLMAGMAYGALYMYSRSLWPAIVAHAVTNFLLGGWILYTGNWNFW